MPGAIALGVSYSDFWRMTPKILNAVKKGHDLRIREMDDYVHQAVGYYGLSALMVSIEHCLFGNKAKTEYHKESLLDDHYIVDKEYEQTEFDEMSEDEQRELLMRGFGLDRLEKKNG